MNRGMTTRQTEALVRQLRELDSDEARALAITRWPEACMTTATARVRPRSESEQLLADVTAMMRIAVRIEVRLLENPLPIDGPDLVRKALGDLAALLGTLEGAIARALALQDKAHAKLA
jgi:hypothetical protein